MTTTQAVLERDAEAPVTLMERRYERPRFEEQEGLLFPREILEAFNGGQFCMQCSSCHGCR